MDALYIQFQLFYIIVGGKENYVTLTNRSSFLARE